MSDNQLLRTEASMSAAQQRQDQERQKLEDMAEVIDSAAGRRIIAQILSTEGLGRYITDTQGGVNGHNRALDLFQTVKKANPKYALEILASIFSLDEVING